jgi:hypothetical protein
MAKSLAWLEFLDRLREVASLWRIDPLSPYFRGSPASATPSVRVSAALGRAAILLTSAHLQGYLESVTQEFLERIDGSGVDVARISLRLRGELSARFPPSGDTMPRYEKAAEAHRDYLPLWTDGIAIPVGTIRTDSLTDSVWNPWWKAVKALLERADVELWGELVVRYGPADAGDVVTHLDELVESRNKLAHGDNSVSATPTDLLRYARAAARMARATDASLDGRLTSVIGVGW